MIPSVPSPTQLTDYWQPDLDPWKGSYRILLFRKWLPVGAMEMCLRFPSRECPAEGIVVTLRLHIPGLQPADDWTFVGYSPNMGHFQRATFSWRLLTAWPRYSEIVLQSWALLNHFPFFSPLRGVRPALQPEVSSCLLLLLLPLSFTGISPNKSLNNLILSDVFLEWTKWY